MNTDTPTSADKSPALQAAEELRAAAGEKAQQLRSAAETRAKEIRNVATEQAEILKQNAGQQAGQIKDAAGQTWDDAINKADDFKVEVEKYVRENPTKSILATFGLGLFVGLMMRR